MSSLEFMSSENVWVKGVITSLAVFVVKSKAPAIILVSCSDNSPPFPAWLYKLYEHTINKSNMLIKLFDWFESN